MPDLNDQLTCCRCNYLLRGIDLNATCPECGCSVRISLIESANRRQDRPNAAHALGRAIYIATLRDVVWLAFIFIFFSDPLSLTLLAPLSVTLFAEGAIQYHLWLAKPPSLPDTPWLDPRQARLWSIAAALSGPLIFLGPCLIFPKLKLLPHFLENALIALCIVVYGLLRCVIWVFPLLHARNESQQPDRPPGLPVWTISLAFTISLPVVCALAFVLGATDTVTHTPLLLYAVLGWSLLGSIFALAGSEQFLDQHPPG